MSKIEILAPVGSEEMLRAAVFSGADAVYLGFSGFNARTGAGNFDADSLKEAVRFCHARGVAVHVALNTTVYGGELAGLADAVRAVAASGADAVICQDLAVAKLIGDIAPQLPRHGSTQMSVHTLQGALELKELGFARVVLARELSLPEVEHITRHCGIETECFVHGALCMCVSGQCYMSAFLGGRSGNRGSCAGPCRLPFEANALTEGKPGRLHHLSLKDNSVIDKLDKLQAIGVASAKIEGRLRTPEYVAAAVSACLAGREGRAYDRDLLKNAFSRSGFTSGYLDGKIDGTMFGVRSEADAELTKKTLPALRELYRRERSRVPVEMKIEIEEGGEKLTVTDGTNKAFAYGDAEPQPARTDPTESLSRSLSKTGGTPFSAEKIDVEMDGGPWFVPGSAINELRREALDALLKKRETLRPWPVNEVELPPLPLRTLPPHRTLRARFERWEQVPEQALSGVEYLILPIAQADRVPREWREKTLLELPRVMFGALEEDTARRIAATQDAGFAGYEVSNIAHLRLCRGLPMAGGFGLNVTNNLAAQYYADLGLRSVLILPEVKDSDISTIAPTRGGKPVPTGVITYGHMPLMVTRACPLQNIHDCAHCDKTGLLTDRKAKKFPVRCGLGVRTIYNPVPIYMGDKPGALTVDYGVAYFTLESREEAAAILDSIRQHGFGTLIMDAMNQSFFTLSLGIAAMEIFGSYMGEEHSLPGEAARICALDTFVALMAGTIIFPACFTFSVQPDNGPSLIFQTLPPVFVNMAGGRFWGALFFLFMVFASFSTVLAVFENILAISMDTFGWSRKKASVIWCVLLAVLSLPCVFGFNLWSNFTPILGKGVLDSEDFLVSNLLLPIGSLVYLLFCVSKWGWGFDKYLAEANRGKGLKLSPKLKPYFQFVLPVLIVIVLLQGLL